MFPILILLMSSRPIQGLISSCQPSEKPPDPRSQCCGVESTGGNRIIGGSETAIEAYPWLAMIIYEVKPHYSDVRCGGSLISSKYVLTAAHCVIGPVLEVATPTDVALGEYDISNDGPDCVEAEGGGEDCTDGAILIPIKTIIPHKDFSTITNKNDIALITTQNTAPYTDFIRPICLPTVDITNNPPRNLEFTIAGWGAIKQKKRYGDAINEFGNLKKHVNIPFVPLKKCPKRLRAGKGQLCAGGVQRQDSCSGDSGGPLMYQRNSIYEVTGIVSYGTKWCGSKAIPGVYTSVYQYLAWIKDQIGLNDGGDNWSDIDEYNYS